MVFIPFIVIIFKRAGFYEDNRNVNATFRVGLYVLYFVRALQC